MAKKKEEVEEGQLAEEAPAGPAINLNSEVPTFGAYDRATGKKIVVDARTFDPELHSRNPIK